MEMNAPVSTYLRSVFGRIQDWASERPSETWFAQSFDPSLEVLVRTESKDVPLGTLYFRLWNEAACINV